MPRYNFTAQAERDLENIIDYTVGHWGQPQAEKYIGGREQLAQELADHPQMGTVRDHLFQGLLIIPFEIKSDL